MQLALQDIRCMGYNKIFNFYIENKAEFFEMLRELNNKFYNLRVPAYSFLDKWHSISVKATDVDKSKRLKGYFTYVNSLEPLIDAEEKPSISAKRRCRNTWNTIWNNFSLVSGLQEHEISLLQDLGLKLPFICFTIENDDFLARVLNFYNIVLTWSVFCQQESNFSKNSMTFIDVLNTLAITNKSSFEDFIYSLC